jgi:hypothetical protein
MARTRSEKKAVNDTPPKVLNGTVQKDKKTDYSRWRLRDIEGRQTWHYLTSDEEIKTWPQTVADKYHLGLPTVGIRVNPSLGLHVLTSLTGSAKPSSRKDSYASNQ